MSDHKRQRDLFRILLALLLCSFHQMPGTCALDHLQLQPPSIVVKIGSPVSVNCSTDTPSDIIGWEISQGDVTKVENKFATWTLQKLTHWDIKPMCYITLKTGLQDSKDLNITIYKPPDRVSISTLNHIGPLIEGTEYNLQCEVRNVAPLRLLTVNWYKGQQLVNTDSSFHNNTSIRPRNITSTLQISPHRDDDGDQYKCEAELKLGPEGPQPPPVASSDPLNITVYYGPEFSNCPKVVWLEEGQSLAGYCNATGRPFPHCHWEREGSVINPAMPLNRTSSGMYEIITNRNATKSMKVEVMYGPEISCGPSYTVTEGEYFIPNCMVEGHPSFQIIWYKDGEETEMPQTMYRTHAGQYTLTAFNNNTIANHSLEIDVWYPPSEISELQNAPVSVGQYVVLKCSSNANPRPKYKWIYHQAPNVRIEDQDGVSLLHINQPGGDNIGTYTCIANNELGETRRKVRVDVQGAKATCPLLLHPQFIALETDKIANMTCTSSASTKSLSWNISNNVYHMSTLLMSSTSLIDTLGWHGNASCHGQFVGLDDCQIDLSITVYKRPDRVSIRTSGHLEPMIEGSDYVLLCDVQNVAPVQFLTVNWYNGQNIVKSEKFNETNPANITSTLKISPNRNDTKIQLSCEAELKLGPELIQVKSEPLNRTVHSKPVIKEKLPRQVPVFRGYPQNLICEASGYPEPTITWIFNNDRMEGGNLTLEEVSGKYTCIASNYLGNDTREVNVILEEDYLPLIAGFVALVVVIISVFFISIYSIYYKNTKMGHYTVEGAKPKAQNGNIAQNGKDSTIPMKKIMV